jgi:predicted RND superfamily exporter protein
MRIIYSALTIVIGLSAFAFKNELNNQFINFFDESVPFRHDSDYIDEKLTGMYNIEFSLPSGQSDGISNPTYLQTIAAFEQWFSAQENVVHVNAFSEVMRRVNRSMHGDQEQYYTLPESQSQAAQYLLMYEMSLPLGLDLNNQINVDRSETRFTATVKNISSKDLLALTTKAENWLKQNTPAYMHESGVGMAIMFSHITKRNMTSMLQGGIMGLVLISFILIAALRSWKYGLISLLPNLAPLGVAFGAWYFMEGLINMSTSIVFGMVLGIIVDDTIHLLSKYVTARREMNKSPEDAVRYAFATVSKAAIITTVILTAGFMVLAQSHFGFNAGMAKVTAITIVIALILDLLLLPAILLSIDKTKQQSKRSEVRKEKAVLVEN